MKVIFKNTSAIFSRFERVDKTYNDSAFSIAGFIEKTGQISSQAEGFHVTDFINISGAKRVEVTAAFGNSYGGGVAFYASNEASSFISSVYNTSSGSTDNHTTEIIPVPSGAKFCRAQKVDRFSTPCKLIVRY